MGGKLLTEEDLTRTFGNPEFRRAFDERLSAFLGVPPKSIGRITDLLTSGEAFRDLGIDGITPETDRAMVCGSMGLNTDMKTILEGFGLEEGANSDPKHYVVEKAFVG